jgi:radical SAM superfamily enzyme YgiQ (UPF0313 family)
VQGLYLDEDHPALEEVENRIRAFDPGLIGFSSVSNQFRYVAEIASHLRSRGVNAPTIVGGPHASIAPEEVLQTDAVDMVCIGEGEEACLEVVSRLEAGEDVSTTMNVWVKTDGGIVKNELRPLIKDLGRLPFPDRELFSFDRILKANRGWLSVQASRGCPYQCSYCINHFMRALYGSSYGLRLRPIEHVIAEIAAITRCHSVAMVNFTDDAFTLDRDWTFRFCSVYARQFPGLPFACNARATCFDGELAKALREGGCAEVKIGLESGCRRIRERILGRPMSDEEIERAFASAHKVGLRTWSLNMLGAPTETPQEVQQTIRMNARIRPYALWCSILYPYKGTQIRKRCERDGLILSDRESRCSSFFEGTVIHLAHLSDAQVVRYRTMFRWYVDASSRIKLAAFYQILIEMFESLPDEAWVSGEAAALFTAVDKAIDDLFKRLQLEHYSSRGHLSLQFSGRTGWALP